MSAFAVLSLVHDWLGRISLTYFCVEWDVKPELTF